MKLFTKKGYGKVQSEKKFKTIAISFLCSEFYEKFLRDRNYTFKEALVSFIYDTKGLNSRYEDKDLERLKRYIAKKRTKYNA